MTPYYYGNSQANTAFKQPVDDHGLSMMEQEIGRLRALTDYADFYLAAVKVMMEQSYPAVDSAACFG